MRMRTPPLVALGVVATLVLAACGSSDDGGGSGGTGSKPVKVTFIQGVAGDPFYETMRAVSSGNMFERVQFSRSLSSTAEARW